MKKISLLFIAGLVLILSPVSHAQKIDLKSGSVASLGALSEIRVEYTYDDMMVGKYKEADYLKKKTDEYNKKEPGKGDQWQKDWVSDRETKFQPRFQDGFNNFCNLTGTNFKIDPNAGGKYRMVVHTSFTEPGFNIYMTSKNASINLEVFFYDESNAEIAKVIITNSPGNGIFEMDYDTGVRIQEAYANAGRELAALILEEAFGKK